MDSIRIDLPIHRPVNPKKRHTQKLIAASELPAVALSTQISIFTHALSSITFNFLNSIWSKVPKLQYNTK